MALSLGEYPPANLGLNYCQALTWHLWVPHGLTGCWFHFWFAAPPRRELLSPFCQEPGQAAAAEAWTGTCHKSKDNNGGFRITPDIHVSDFDI